MAEKLVQAQLARAAHVAALLTKQNVVACGVGYKISGGQITDEPSIVVSVSRKLPIAQLAERDLVPSTLDGVTTDVFETGVIRAFWPAPPEQHADPVAHPTSGSQSLGPRDRWRPAPPGVSVGHADITAGTFGCLVQRGTERLILSNNHVLANSNQGQVGDAILQPGRADGGVDADKIAELADYIALDFGDGPTGCGAVLARLQNAFRPSFTGQPAQPGENLVDAALALPLSDTLVSSEILEIGVPAGVAEGTLGADVQKSGRTTGYTSGQIIQIDVTA